MSSDFKMSKRIGRIFLAFDIHEHEPVDAFIQDLQNDSDLPELRFIPQEKRHQTLCFLGQCSLVTVDKILKKLPSKISEVQPFEVVYNRVCWFPNAKNPKVLVLRHEPCQALETLVERTEEVVEALGFEHEKRSYKGHLTLARVKARKGVKTKQLNLSAPIIQSVNFIAIYQSETLPSGAKYTLLGTIHLG